MAEWSLATRSFGELPRLLCCTLQGVCVWEGRAEEKWDAQSCCALSLSLPHSQALLPPPPLPPAPRGGYSGFPPGPLYCTGRPRVTHKALGRQCRVLHTAHHHYYHHAEPLLFGGCTPGLLVPEKGPMWQGKGGRKPAGGLTRRPTHCKVDCRVSRPLHSPNTGSK